jgi:uncharacterized protein (TIGR02421 family)
MIHESKSRFEKIEERLDENSGIHFQFDDFGVIHIERKLPFLLVYRPGRKTVSDIVIENIVKNEASYLICSDDKYPEYRVLLKKIVKKLSDEFGAFLLMEIWSVQDTQLANSNLAVFEIFGPEELPETVSPFKNYLENMSLAGLRPQVKLIQSGERSPEHLEPLLDKKALKNLECLLLGFKVETFYKSLETDKIYPLLERRFYSEFSMVFKKTVFDFLKVQANHNISGFQSLARRELMPEIWEIDEQLLEIDNRIRFLMLVSPVNGSNAWKEFKKNHYKKNPVFHYRMIPEDPELIKRTLFNIRIEDIDDPTLGYLFREKRTETDKMLTMLNERESPDFFYGSLQLFGGVENRLIAVAQKLLESYPIDHSVRKEPVEYYNAKEFAEMARQELLFLQEQWAGVKTDVEIKDTIDNMMVDKGVIYIPQKMKISRKRAEAMIQHEIGTHVLTYYNGKNQPLKLLSSGISGYEELQEGIAILVEYLSGGLSKKRMQELAGRVIAVDSLINHHNFVKTFELLTDGYNFKPRKAFFITTRVYRGGGFTKDAIYLRGLLALIQYLKKGNPLESLLIGKVRQNYLPVIEELISRKILKPMPIKPRYLIDKEALQRLAAIKKIEKVTELINFEI